MIKKYFVIVLLAIFGAGCNTPAPYYPTVDDTTGDNSSETKTYLRTGNYTDLTHNSVTLLGEVKVEIADYESIEWGMMHSTDKDELEARNGERVFSTDDLIENMYSVFVNGLEAETKYYYCAFVNLNNKQYRFGETNEFTTLAAPKNLVIGVFSVSDSKQVTFSEGNLQYHPANDEWRFAESQLDYIGDANSNCSSTYNGWLDLFGWSTSTTNFGVSTSTDESDYSGSFVDWGTNKIGNDAPNTWRTLTFDEWYYLRYNRTNANDLCGVAQVNGVNGLIFLPDNWTCPAGVTFESGFHNSDGTEYYAAYQTFTADQWLKLEAAGAVFLPVAGYRGGPEVHYVQLDGYYWSATERGSDGAYYLDFNSDAACVDYENRIGGMSVRLVKDL